MAIKAAGLFIFVGPLEELIIAEQQGDPLDEECVVAIVGFVRSQHMRGVPFKFHMRSLPERMAERLKPWVGTVHFSEETVSGVDKCEAASLTGSRRSISADRWSTSRGVVVHRDTRERKDTELCSFFVVHRVRQRNRIIKHRGGASVWWGRGRWGCHPSHRCSLKGWLGFERKGQGAVIPDAWSEDNIHAPTQRSGS